MYVKDNQNRHWPIGNNQNGNQTLVIYKLINSNRNILDIKHGCFKQTIYNCGCIFVFNYYIYKTNSQNYPEKMFPKAANKI